MCAAYLRVYTYMYTVYTSMATTYMYDNHSLQKLSHDDHCYSTCTGYSLCTANVLLMYTGNG